MFHKGEHEKQFAYTVHTACDKNGFILALDVSPGNVHDSVKFFDLYRKVNETFPESKYIVADAGYKTPPICRAIINDNKQPVMPYKRPMSKKGFFKSYEYVYDEYYNCVICPRNQILKYSTTTRDGYREFKSNPIICKNCEDKFQCTHSKNNVKVVTKHIWSEYIEIAEDIRHSPIGKELYPKRSETIERVFADAKEKHGFRYTNYRGKAKMKMEALLTFIAMNMKKLANWTIKDYGPSDIFIKNRVYFFFC